MSRRPDAVTSSNSFVKSEPNADSPVPLAPTSAHHIDLFEDDDDDDDENDPIVRTIDVFISPELSNTIHLLQFPIQPINTNSGRNGATINPTEAKLRPKHNMLELEYPLPSSAQGGHRQLPDKMCLSSRTYTSNSIAPVTHMALARLNRSGTKLDIVPLTKSVFQMRPSFQHLHDDDEDDDPNARAIEEANSKKHGGKQRPIMYQKKETERSANARRNSYAHKRAQEEQEEWVELDVHGAQGKWSDVKKEMIGKIKCKDRENELKVAKMNAKAEEGGDGGYVKSLNYLVSKIGEGFVENLSDWAPSGTVPKVTTINEDGTADDDDDIMDMMDDEPEETPSAPIGLTEQATAELASKLAILLQNGNGTMIPYRVLRSRFHHVKVTDEILTMGLSACAVLVRGNFALKSNLCKFLSNASIGGGENKKRVLRELRDLILLLLNMHGMVQRERLARAYAAKAETSRTGDGYDGINADTITFVLQTVAKKENDCWVAKVEDDEEFAAQFSEVAACHGMYWLKKKDMMVGLIELYENAQMEAEDDDLFV